MDGDTVNRSFHEMLDGLTEREKRIMLSRPCVTLSPRKPKEGQTGVVDMTYIVDGDNSEKRMQKSVEIELTPTLRVLWDVVENGNNKALLLAFAQAGFELGMKTAARCACPTKTDT